MTSSKPVRIPESVKEQLFDFVDGQTTKRAQNRIGKLTPGEGVKILLDTYNKDRYIRACFKLVKTLISYASSIDNPWDHTNPVYANEFIYCVKSFYDLLLVAPKHLPHYRKDSDIYERLQLSIKQFLDEYSDKISEFH